MIEVIIGNVCSIGAMLSDSFSGTRKTRKGMLLAQTVSQLFYLASSIVLKGYSAAAQNGVAIARNLFAAFEVKSKFFTYFFIILPVILGLYFNNLGALGLVPIISNLVYAISMFAYANQPRKLKYSFIFMCMTFSFFNFMILNFVAGISCIISSVTTVIALWQESKNRKTNSELKGS